MTNNSKEVIIFYLYDYNNNLVTREKTIYSPYNIKTYGRTKFEDYYRENLRVSFKNWLFELDPDTVSEIVYEQTKEFLNFYNQKWWKLTKWVWESSAMNGRYFKNDNVHIVRTELVDNRKIEKITLKEKETIIQIPLNVAEMLTVKQLQQIAFEEWIEIPKEFENSTPNEIKKTIIKSLQDAGKIWS